MVINVKGECMSDMVAEYNRVLDFCRDTPQRKFNIQMELGITSGRLGTMMTRLVTRKLLKAANVKGNRKLYEYHTTPDAVYTVLPVFGAGRPTNDSQLNKGIMVQGNVTTVTSGSYHTKGTTAKRSVWIGSSADL